MRRKGDCQERVEVRISDHVRRMEGRDTSVIAGCRRWVGGPHGEWAWGGGVEAEQWEVQGNRPRAEVK